MAMNDVNEESYKAWMCIICGWIYDEKKERLKRAWLPERDGKMFPNSGCVRTAVPAKKISI